MSKKNLFGLLAVVVLAVGTVWLSNTHFASAQNVLGTWQSNSQITGLKIPVYNSTDSLIVSGMAVQLDTTTAATTNLKAMVVKRYTGTLSDRIKVVGVAAGNIARSSKGGAGSVLIFGYHPGVFASSSTTPAAGAYIRLSTLNGAVKDASDSVSMNVGWCVSLNSGAVTGAQGSTANRYTMKAFVNFLTPKVIGSL